MKDYTINQLKFDSDLVKKVTARRKKGEPISEIAKALNIGTGKAAMALLIGTNPHKNIKDPAKLAKAIVKDRQAGASWGLLAARYGVTETTAKAAYEAATNQPYSSLDYRKKEVTK